MHSRADQASLDEQAKIAQARDHLTPDRIRRLDRVLNELERWIDLAMTAPALLHGDWRL